eukprot:comp16659_c0_seq1/m.14870 comp16659_c0_seq1/g.14870  ORF comp16659_c0_seq1/g.14870 comp16659_c0_seq1/m.14870 type:complete len:300 (-) comp16659_c0_seq1:345-1244(-)
MATQQKKLPASVSFATAGLGGVLGWIVVHPANTCAIRMNLATMTAPPGQKTASFVKFTSNVIKNEGVGSLYKGLTAGITRQIFYATSRFGLYEVFRDQMAKYRETDILSRVINGVLSGGCAAVISCPAEVSLVRMSNDNALPKEQRRNYKGVYDAASRIMREEGFAAFYRGCAPFVNRAMLVGACQVATYDQFKVSYKNMGLTGLSNECASSMSAGLLYSIITMPFETAKNRMAFQKPDANGKLPYKGTFQTIGAVAKASGVLSLWNGFIPYFTRCGGHTVMMFLFVEQLRKLYWDTVA